ncbi:MAG: CarD family transcriptional regulator [Ruminococcaceae bacterium]|nr:CarD family transcriptional regulator [Oscillospiraceae bacterium]
MQYQIGSKVVYPMHGAGVIEAIEEREIMGVKQNYYIMRIPVGDMKVMVPMLTAEEIGLRDVIDEAEADRVLSEFKACPVVMDSNWNKRYRENMERIKSGNIYDVVYVVKNLMLRDKARGLSTGERKMLSNAKQILVSELVVAKAKKQHEIEQVMNDIIEAELA